MIPQFRRLLLSSALNQNSHRYSVLSSLPSNMTLGRASSGTYWNGTAIATAGSNVPRFDAPGGPSGLSGLLIEPQFQNMFLQSGFVSGWTTSTNTALNVSSDTAPAGGTAYKLTGNAGVASEYTYQSVAFTSGSQYIVQVFVKPINKTAFRIQSFTQSGTADFTLIGAGSVGGVSGIVATQGIVYLSNGWYFCWAVMTANATGSNSVGFNYNSGGYVGDCFSVWGAQIGLGSAPSSYVPTTTSAATRAADVLTYNGNDSAQSMILTASDGSTQELRKDPFVPWVINPLNLNKLNIVRMQTGTPNALFGFDVINTQTVSGNLSTAAGTTVTIYWGDGTSTALSGSSQAYSKTYTAAVYKSVVIKGPIGALTTFTMDNGSANISFNLSSLPSGLTYFYCGGNNTVSGSVSSLPPGLTVFQCFGNNTVSGSVSSLPSRLTYFFCVGNNTVAGLVSSLPSGLTYFNHQGNNTISGSVSSLPPGLTYFNCGGNNTVSGSVSSLPSGITYFNCLGNNAVSGSVSSLPPGLTFFNCVGNNTVSGSVSSLPSGLTVFACQGNNTVSGSVSSLPSGLTYFYCAGNNTVNAYTTKTWANNQDTIYLVPVAGGGLSAGSVDQLCIDLANVATWTGGKTLYLKGTNAAPTSASAAARATLAGKGVTVTTN